MFRKAHLVFKNGEPVVRDGEVDELPLGPHAHAAARRSTPAMQRRLAEYFDTYYGYPAGITDVRESAVAAMADVESVFEEVACRS